MRPGNHPIANLASALAAAIDAVATLGGPGASAAAVDPTRAAALDGRLRLSGIGLIEAVRLAHLPPRVRVVVVVDQFEEIFRFRRMTDQDESAAFVKLLLHAAFDPESPVSVVLTLRSDTLGYCADFRDLPEAISRGQYLVPRLTRDQRKNAIVGPVELRGFRVAPRLVQRVLNDVSDDFDDLPVMQHALSRTWRRWATACDRVAADRRRGLRGDRSRGQRAVDARRRSLRRVDGAGGGRREGLPGAHRAGGRRHRSATTHAVRASSAR